MRHTDGGIGFSDPSGAPMMSGTWINPQTGHKFTVRDCFFQDGQFMVTTTEGQMLDYATIQNYIQATDKAGNPDELATVRENRAASGSGSPLGNLYATRQTPMDIPSSLVSELEDSTEQAPYLEDNIYPTHTHTQSQAPDFDTTMIERALGKKSLPILNASLDWPDAPTKQLEILTDTFGVDPQKISEWYISRIDMAAVRSRCIELLTEALNKLQQSGSPKEEEPAQEELPQKRKRK